MTHPTTFQYLQPTDAQKEAMQKVRDAAQVYAELLAATVPDGPDKTFIMRELRTVAMWANIAITRNPDGTPRP